MKKFLENLAALVKVKTMVTFGVLVVFMVLALTGKIDPDSAMIIISMVVSFYFGTQSKENRTTSVAAITAPSTEPVAIIAEQVAPIPEPVDNATYSKIHPDSE